MIVDTPCQIDVGVEITLSAAQRGDVRDVAGGSMMEEPPWDSQDNRAENQEIYKCTLVQELRRLGRSQVCCMLRLQPRYATSNMLPSCWKCKTLVQS